MEIRQIWWFATVILTALGLWLISFSKQSILLLGGRYDYNTNHGNVFSPRANYKWMSKSKKTILRFTAGNGFRVVNIFTEEHQAFTGTRELIIQEELKPEKSWNGNVNYVKKFLFKNDVKNNQISRRCLKK